MGKHSRPSDDGKSPVPGTVSDDTWTKVVTAAVASDNGDAWVVHAVRSEENARHN